MLVLFTITPSIEFERSIVQILNHALFSPVIVILSVSGFVLISLFQYQLKYLNLDFFCPALNKKASAYCLSAYCILDQSI